MLEAPPSPWSMLTTAAKSAPVDHTDGSSSPMAAEEAI